MVGQLCDLHSEVVATAPRPNRADVSRRFPRASSSPRLARWFVAEVLRSWDCHDLVDDAVLVVSELATNAMAHGGTDFTVSLVKSGPVIRVIVGDGSSTVPTYRKAPVSAENGRGLHLVENLSRGWGYELVAGGKLVWIDVVAPERTRRAAPSA
jgi:anti-sigma regulatory factor (Ser/Thr protein kinase)